MEYTRLVIHQLMGIFRHRPQSLRSRIIYYHRKVFSTKITNYLLILYISMQHLHEQTDNVERKVYLQYVRIHEKIQMNLYELRPFSFQINKLIISPKQVTIRHTINWEDCA